MKVVFGLFAAAAGFVFLLVGADVLIEDATFSEAWKEVPQQFQHYLSIAFASAWEHKEWTLIVVAILVGIIYLRHAPNVQSR